MLTVAPEIAATLRSATFDAFDTIIDLCLQQQVDALLVAGDVFDSADRSLAAQLAFARGLGKLHEAGIRAIVCHGNHDPLDTWDARIPLPPSAYRFEAEVSATPLRADDDGSPLVYGISYPTRDVWDNLVPRFQGHVERGRAAIGLLHANVGGHQGHENYAPCTLRDLASLDIGYWALGHVHTRRIDEAGSVLAAYPGNPQGRNPTEIGARGVFLIEVSDGGEFSNPVFHAVDKVRWTQVSVEVAGMDDQTELEAAVRSSLDDARGEADGRHLVYRLALTGRGPLHSLLADSDFVSAFRQQLNDAFVEERPFAFCERLSTLTRPAVDRAELLLAGGFVGDLLALVDGLADDPETLADLRSQLEPLHQNARVRRYLGGEPPDAADLLALVARAETHCLDLLAGEDA